VAKKQSRGVVAVVLVADGSGGDNRGGF